MIDSQESLIDLLERCEADTHAILGAGAARRLGNWRKHSQPEAQLVGYIQRLLRGEHRENGWTLDQAGGLSLERIVLDHRPDLFAESDLLEARRTLAIRA